MQTIRAPDDEDARKSSRNAGGVPVPCVGPYAATVRGHPLHLRESLWHEIVPPTPSDPLRPPWTPQIGLEPQTRKLFAVCRLNGLPGAYTRPSGPELGTRVPWIDARVPWLGARIAWISARIAWISARVPCLRARTDAGLGYPDAALGYPG
eukprot:1179582-Prorocentrum_minimum.AAC.2